MTTSRCLIALALVALLAAPASAAPALPLVEKEGKIGECISYDPKVGLWWTTAATKVYARERDRSKVVATVPAKARLTPVTGNVYTTAYGKVTLKGALQAYDDDGGETRIPGGTALSVVRYEGEGAWLVVHNGKQVYASLSESVAYPSAQFPAPKTEWWVQVRTKQGQTGWVFLDEKTVAHGVAGCNDLPPGVK